MKKIISLPIVLLFILMSLAVDCDKTADINPEYVMQIKNIGLRQDVFLRRFQLSGNYGKHQNFTSDSLKNFIQKILEPNYLFIQHAYDLGYDKEPQISQEMIDYGVNLLSSNHPIIYENLTIVDDDLRDFHNKKSIQFDVDLIQTTAYGMADSIYRSMVAGRELPYSKPDQPPFIFPKKNRYRDVTYGEVLHPDIFPVLFEMKEGELSKPIYTGPYWSIVVLNKREANKKLPSFEQTEKELINQAQAIFKYKKQKQLVDKLKEKYPVSIQSDLYQPLIDAYRFKDGHGWIDSNRLNQDHVSADFPQINNDIISLTHFISIFNQANQYSQIHKLTEQDLTQFVDEYIAQYLLYLDAVEKGVDQKSVIQDKLQNKEHRLLIAKYLKDEIAKKIKISDEDAQAHYQAHQNKWNAGFEEVISLVKDDLMNQRLIERKENVLKKLHSKYDVRYNEPLLVKLAEQLTAEKQLMMPKAE